MKKVIDTQPGIININSIGTHGIIGIEGPFNERYCAVQVKPAGYMIIGEDYSNGMNRQIDDVFDGVNELAKYCLKEGFSVYIFDTPQEMLRWLIDKHK